MVATDIAGTREVVIHERTGLLVPPRNPQALADAIARILNDRTLGEQLGRDGRRYVEKRFDVQTQIERTVDLYRELPIGKNRFQRHPRTARLLV
jgi:glycosyltransferase involved in cell wall biosynthesis